MTTGAEAGLIGSILPAAVIGVEAFGDEGAGPLFPQERETVRRAVPGRVAEFTTVRHCARRALQGLGIEPVPIPTSPSRAPVWPPGVVGSLTHCAGYRAAAVAWGADAATIGIDAEPDLPLPGDTLSVVASASERDALAALPAGPAWDRLLFSVKESMFKAWHPLMGEWLGFEDADVRLFVDGTATVRLLGAGLVVDDRTVRDLPVSWRRGAGLLVTAITLPGPGRQAS